MKLILKMMRAWGGCLALCIASQVLAAPDYVTAWPKQVPVEKPDPVLGDKPFWEHWVYSEAFAKRFKGFPLEKADPELQGGMQAMALRIYKKNLWQGLNPNYPEQYACELDVYFSSKISLPLSESGKPRQLPRDHPLEISESYKRLVPVGEIDSLALSNSKPANANLQRQPLVFADRPLDGRYASFGVREYHPELVPGLAAIALASSIFCSVTAPKDESGIHWLSLSGNRPYNKDDRDSTLWRGMEGGWGSRVKTEAFNPGLNPEVLGYFQIPEIFNKVVLPKVTLVKMLNRCITQREAHFRRKLLVDEAWLGIERRCREAEETGLINPGYPGKDGLQDPGF